MPPSLNPRLAERVVRVLALLQCVAGHDKTRIPFIRANIPMYLFPFLHTTNTCRECECFKLTSLGIIGCLVKADVPEIIQYLLQNEFVPLCLRILKFGQEISRIVAAYIVQKILADANDMDDVCRSREKLDTVITVLNIVLVDLAQNFSPRLAKNVIESYNSLLQKEEARRVIAAVDPEKLKLGKLTKCNDEFVKFVGLLKGLVGQRGPRAN